MPPVGSKHVVTIHAVARMLGWTAARIRRIDDVLRPTRAGTANGERLYDVDRVLFLVETIDNAPPVPAPIVISAAEYKELRQRWREQRFVPHGNRTKQNACVLLPSA
jgi:hypothetical protein